MIKDICWIQRLDNWAKALGQLTRFMDRTELNELEELGVIHAFENSHDLAWKTQKDFLEAQGVTDLFGSKNVARQAFSNGLITDGAVWLDMIESRNLTSHNEDTTRKIVADIIDRYYPAFCDLHRKLIELARKEQDEG